MTNALVPWTPSSLRVHNAVTRVARDAVTPSLFDIGSFELPEPRFSAAPMYPTNRWYIGRSRLGMSIFLFYPKRFHISLMFDLNAQHETFGRTLMENAIIQVMSAEGRGTAAPQEICLYWHNPVAHVRVERPQPLRHSQTQTAAQKLISNIQLRSGLTLEEIAPLIGVTRRSLQHWRAQGQISARNEQRLRDIADTLDSLPFTDAQRIRQRLFDRDDTTVRPYDLLAEGRFDVAYMTMTKSPAPTHLVERATKRSLPAIPSLLARLSSQDGGPALSNERVDLRRSRRLKR